ncbi:hypothetical protein BABINDRAFT_161768 [Babjeviella inositovora NRRL Y-12698]|uniref:OPT family small oligopeptide transporter n=1 Tax=Babjeviella inositovora NRRL Y-12698 TaxID=984486 RepID=A0A1E3QQL6_9ASCO|nr:uncharacterized protein BABINDRAFT_161768 [Babjeviella inositovora NRRL Y-12698]ODQ79362.1 hypothetical protein BABINDRAFT_161768 [Babjeviella inositovora NRRL Y-12698]
MTSNSDPPQDIPPVYKDSDQTFFGDIQAVLSNPASINEIGNSLSSDQKFQVLARTGHAGLEDLDDLPVEAEYMIIKVDNLTIDESLEILKDAIVYHKGDVNFLPDEYNQMVALVKEGAPVLESDTGLHAAEKFNLKDKENFKDSTDDKGSYISDWEFECRLLASLIHFHSPYAEVRAVTDPYDDPSVPVETIRSYFLAFIWTVIGSGVNEFFSHRQPSISLDTSVIQLFLYPCGKILELLPDWGFTVRGKRYSINPGPWSYKEQMFATICYSVSAAGAYVDSNIIVQKLGVYYDNDWADFGYQVLLIFSTQCLGFGFAGIMRKVCIYPVRSIWPTILPTLALNRALLKPEKREIINGWRISKYNFFWIFSGASFLYFWIPNYLFGAVSTFNWLTWIKPMNFNLAAITGSVLGLGLNPIPTFDWNIINFNSALVIPFYSQLNLYIGSLFAFFCIIGVYWGNYKWTGYLPINDNSLFTNTADYYDVTQILTNGLFDNEKYQAYSPPFYSAANLVLYGAFCALYPFGFIYTIYDQWESMKSAGILLYKTAVNFRRSNFEGLTDPHSRMMGRYKEVPDWWFLIILVISIVLGILCVELYPTNTPVWGIFFTIGINFVFLIPLTTIMSITGYQFGLNVLVELIIGYALTGNGVALMTLKAYGYNINGQAQNYVSDQKLAHYAKISPMAIFRGQLMATIVQCFVVLGVVNWMLSNVKDFCQPHQGQKFTCPNETTFYSSSIFWGVIGPKKVFSGLYPILQWCFLIGALLPIPCVLFKKYGPKRLTYYFQPTLIIGGFLQFAPYNLSYLTGSLYASFAFMYYIKNKYASWWEKYNYVLTSALTAGTAFSGVIIFFAVQYHDKSISWWGNNVPYDGIDGGNGPQSLLNSSALPDGYFGPISGNFP